jgi:hypothetical protein
VEAKPGIIREDQLQARDDCGALRRHTGACLLLHAARIPADDKIMHTANPLPAGRGAGGLTSPPDRRRSERRPTKSTATLYSAGEGSARLCKRVAIIDLSLHGVGFRFDEPLDVRRNYSLEIRTEQMNLTARIRIVSCRPRDDAHYDVGAEFH